MKWKKSESIKRGDGELNIQYIGKDTGTKKINRQWKQGCLMQKG